MHAIDQVAGAQEVRFAGGGGASSDIRRRHGALRDAVFQRIRDEWQRSIAALLEITGQRELLAGNPLLMRSIRNRFPYLDPLNHLQVELLRRYRAGSTDERTLRAIHLTINGVAAGLRNSG